MNVLLIYPPNLNIIKTNVPSFVDEQTGSYPPLGLLYIAAYAQKNTKANIEILDCQAEKLTYPQIEETIIKKEPDIVGIQAFTFTIIDAIEVSKMVKNNNPETHVCVGGPHVNIFSDETIKLESIDSVVRREGESTFSDLINVISTKGDISNVKGLIFKKNGQVVDTGLRDFLSNDELNLLPHPARDLIDINKYHSLIAKTNPITTIMSSRGCPFKCTYCDRPQMGKHFRYRNADNIIEEIEECLIMGIREFFFYDDTFTINKKRVFEFCDKLIQKGLHKEIRWDIRSRIDTVNEDLIQMVSKAGCERIHYGVEAGTDRILKILKKEIRIEEVKKVFKITQKYNIKILAYFMLGNPGESKEDILHTIKLAKDLKPNYVHFAVMTPYPATELYGNALNNNVFKDDYWNTFAKSPTKDFQPELLTEKLTSDELTNLLYFAYKSFYLSPFYIINEFLQIKSFKEFKKKAIAAIKLFSQKVISKH